MSGDRKLENPNLSLMTKEDLPRLRKINKSNSDLVQDNLARIRAQHGVMQDLTLNEMVQKMASLITEEADKKAFQELLQQRYHVFADLERGHDKYNDYINSETRKNFLASVGGRQIVTPTGKKVTIESVLTQADKYLYNTSKTEASYASLQGNFFENLLTLGGNLSTIISRALNIVPEKKVEAPVVQPTKVAEPIFTPTAVVESKSSIDTLQDTVKEDDHQKDLNNEDTVETKVAQTEADTPPDISQKEEIITEAKPPEVEKTAESNVDDAPGMPEQTTASAPPQKKQIEIDQEDIDRQIAIAEQLKEASKLVKADIILEMLGDVQLNADVAIKTIQQVASIIQQDELDRYKQRQQQEQADLAYATELARESAQTYVAIYSFLAATTNYRPEMTAAQGRGAPISVEFSKEYKVPEDFKLPDSAIEELRQEKFTDPMSLETLNMKTTEKRIACYKPEGERVYQIFDEDILKRHYQANAKRGAAPSFVCPMTKKVIEVGSVFTITPAMLINFVETTDKTNKETVANTNTGPSPKI